MQLSPEAYVQALASPTIQIVVGDTDVQIPCPLAFLGLHSVCFAKLLSKPGAIEENGGQLKLQGVTKSSVVRFVHWCHLCQPLALNMKEDTTVQQLKEEKDTLIELWIFTDKYNIGRLQNEAMARLRELLGTHPFLLTKEDIRLIFSRTPDSYSSLRRLSITVLVAQLHAPNTTTKAEDFDELLFKGVISMLYKSMRNWTTYVLSGNAPEEGKALIALLNHPLVVKMLNVKEDDPPLWVLTLCGITPKSATSGLQAEPIEMD